MALADRTRQSGKAATRWPIAILLSNGSNTEPLKNKTVIGHRVAALSLYRFVASCLPEPLQNKELIVIKNNFF